MNGTIKTLNQEKGFGFIKGEDGNEYFFHSSGLLGGVYFESLEKGNKVTFEPTQGLKGKRAENVEVV